MLRWFTVSTFQISSWAFWAVWVDTECVFTSRCWDWSCCNKRQLLLIAIKWNWINLILTIEFSCSTINGPVIVAVVVCISLSIEQQTIFASFQCQCAICAQEELVTVVWVCVGLMESKLKPLLNCIKMKIIQKIIEVFWLFNCVYTCSPKGSGQFGAGAPWAENWNSH